MGALGAVIGALIAGAIGSAAWALLFIYGDVEHGLLAWALGGAVGFGTLIGSGRKVSMTNGVLASIVAVLSVFGGKYVAIESYLHVLPPGFLTSYFADDVASEFMDEGREFTWPPADANGNRISAEHYPGDVWAIAEERWNELGPEGQAEYEAAHRSFVDEETGKSELQRTVDAIQGDLNLFDLLFLGLAIATAFRLGSGMMGGEDEE